MNRFRDLTTHVQKGRASAGQRSDPKRRLHSNIHVSPSMIVQQQLCSTATTGFNCYKGTQSNN